MHTVDRRSVLQFGYKWDISTLIERQLIDYTRVTLPNVAGMLMNHRPDGSFMNW